MATTGRFPSQRARYAETFCVMTSSYHFGDPAPYFVQAVLLTALWRANIRGKLLWWDFRLERELERKTDRVPNKIYFVNVPD